MEAPNPDGRYVWFNSTRSGLMQLWRMEADGSNPTQMTFDESNNWFAHISPDGEQVVFISYQKEDAAPDKHPPNKNRTAPAHAQQGRGFQSHR